MKNLEPGKHYTSHLLTQENTKKASGALETKHAIQNQLL
jgi:hypothetical protein